MPSAVLNFTAKDISMPTTPVYSVYNSSIIAQAEVSYGSRGQMIGIDCDPEVVRVILRDSKLFLDHEIDDWGSTCHVIVPVGTGYERVIQEAKRQGLAYKVQVYHTPQRVQLEDYVVDEGQT